MYGYNFNNVIQLINTTQVKIYSTPPVHRFGQLFMFDILHSQINQRGFDLFAEDDIIHAFSLFQTITYSERVSLHDQTGETNIEIVPYSAGHSIGGTIWRIKKDAEDIVYAVDYNHRRENHLNPTALEKIGHPSVLITDSQNASIAVKPKREREKEFLEMILNTLRNEGDVLIPCDTSARVLELLFCINRYWEHSKLSYPIVFLSNTSDSTVNIARSQLEWMTDTIVNNFTNNRDNAFDLKCIKTCISIQELDYFKGPRVILASVSSLNTGFALEILPTFANVEENIIIFTERPQKDSIASKIMPPAPKELVLNTWRRVPLVGKELENYRLKIRQEIEDWETKRKKEIEARRKAQAAKDGEYEGEDTESANTLFDLWQKHDLYVSKDKTFEMLGLHPMFPYIEKRAIFDDFGEVIKLEDMNIGLESVANNSEGIMDDVPCPVEEEVPTKPKLMELEIKINCKVHFIDFEGRSDGESMKKIIKNVDPRKLVMVHGNPEAIKILKDYFRKDYGDYVFTPQNLCSEKLSSGINHLQIKLREDLLSNLTFVRLDDYNIANVKGRFKIAKLHDTNAMEMNHVTAFDLELDADTYDDESRLLGNIKLSEFKQLLSEKGFKTILKSGVLEVNDGVVKIRKEDTGTEGESKLRIDGVLCDDYYKIRDLLYSNLTAL